MELPSTREYEEIGAVLAERIDRWEAESWSRGLNRVSNATGCWCVVLRSGGSVRGGAAVGGARRRDRRGSPRRIGGVDRGLRYNWRLPGPREPRGGVAPAEMHARMSSTVKSG